MSRAGVTPSTRDAMARATSTSPAIEPAPKPKSSVKKSRRLDLTGLGRTAWFLRPKYKFTGIGFVLGFAVASWFAEHVVRTRVAQAKRAYEEKRNAERRVKRERAEAAKRSGPIIEIIDDDSYVDGDPSLKVADVGSSEEEYKMVLVARTDVPMSGGKLGAQCAHAAVGVVQKLSSESHAMLLGRWELDGSKKVTLGVGSKSQFDGIVAEAKGRGLPFYVVEDAGRTEIAAGTVTVCAIGPAAASAIDAVTGNLRLY